MKTIRSSFVGTAAIVAAAFLFVSCSELKDDLKQPVTGGGGVHEEGWSQVSSPDFHGRFLKSNDYEDASCTSCHGTDYAGGTSQVSCFTCHAAYPHEAAFPSGRHTRYLRANLFPLDQCQTCHGAAYDGGLIVEEGCQESGCHVDGAGVKKSPEACNTCHGDFRSAANLLLSYAPPKGVAGETDSTVAAVGAHQAHLKYGTDGVSLQCTECHAIPPLWNSAGHIDPAPRAEVVFTDTLAKLVTGSGTNVPNVSYDPATNKCGNSYCHGNWVLKKSSAPTAYQSFYSDTVMVGVRSFAPVWTGGSAQSACGTCHGLPPQGHLSAGSCANCHTGVVNASLVIINEALHINGKVNVFNSERPMQ